MQNLCIIMSSRNSYHAVGGQENRGPCPVASPYVTKGTFHPETIPQQGRQNFRESTYCHVVANSYLPKHQNQFVSPHTTQSSQQTVTVASGAMGTAKEPSRSMVSCYS